MPNQNIGGRFLNYLANGQTEKLIIQQADSQCFDISPELESFALKAGQAALWPGGRAAVEGGGSVGSRGSCAPREARPGRAVRAEPRVPSNVFFFRDFPSMAFHPSPLWPLLSRLR